MAEVTAKTATPEDLADPELTTIESPMLLEVDIPLEVGQGEGVFFDFSGDSRLQHVGSPGFVPPGAWRSTETAQFVCEQLQVLEVWAVKRKAGRRRADLWMGVTIGAPAPDYVADITLSLVVDGRPVVSEFWEEEDIDSDAEMALAIIFAGPMVLADGPANNIQSFDEKWKVDEEQWEAWFADGAAPKLRVVLQPR